MKTWNVGGRRATNRAGAAEYLGLSPNTVTRYSSPAGRSVFGWPEPLPEKADGQEVFALEDLDAVRRPAPTPAAAAGDPEELIGVREFAQLKGIARATMKRYVEDSAAAWWRGEDGYLPRPDEWPPQPGPARGYVYRWRRRTATAWLTRATPRTGGRKPGRRPQVADLVTLLTEAGPQRPTVRELAASLSARLDTDVSAQVVRRLLRAVGSTDEDTPT